MANKSENNQQAKLEQKQKEKKRQEQQKLLTKLEKEVKDLEFKMNHQNLINTKIKTIKNLKISARTLQLVAPYVLTAGMIFGGFAYLNITPFYNGDEWKVPAKVMTEFDTLGNTKYKKKYSSFDSDNKLYHYTKWKKNQDGSYSRMITTYSLKKKNYEEIVELLKQENLKEIIEPDDDIIEEKKEKLSEEELQTEEFIQAVVYSVDENDYIIQKETVKGNIVMTIIYLILTVCAERMAFAIRDTFSSFDYSECIDKIREQHSPMDVESVARKLELKKENYNRMMR